LVLYLEKDVGNIKTAEDALWWSYITITTVGYGDFYPVTNLGKLSASILILNGIAIFGAIISYINERVNTIKNIYSRTIKKYNLKASLGTIRGIDTRIKTTMTRLLRCKFKKSNFFNTLILDSLLQ
jgi:hypothetical protein